MRRILAAALLAAVAVPTTSYAAGPGCVTEYFLTGDDTEGGDPIVVQNPDGSISIYPPSVTVPAPVPTALAWVAHVNGFVDCVV